MHHGTDYTPYEGMAVTGWPVMTIPRAIRRLAEDLALLRRHLAAQERDHRPTGDGHAFVGRVVGAVMHELLADDLLAVRVPQHEVGVEPDRDRALVRIEPVHLGVVGRSERDELVGGDAALDHALAPENRQPRLPPGNPVRHPAEQGALPGGGLALP